mmetsp:Transcript_22804/g.58024  ORF Transcript_22804/g.58024 Transcript_22804/m.58024 type:complete len:574 (+) Transcript_22804:400-2121(+)
MTQAGGHSTSVDNPTLLPVNPGRPTHARSRLGLLARWGWRPALALGPRRGLCALLLAPVLLAVLLAARRLAAQVLVLLLNQADERVAAARQLLRRAALEEPVEAEAPRLADLRLEVVPVAVAQLVHHAQDEAVLLLRVRLALVGAVLDLELLPRVLVPLQLHGHRVHDVRLALDLELAALNVLEHLLPVVELAEALPEHIAVLAHILLGLALNLGGDLRVMLAAVLLARAHKRVEVLAAPVGEALLQQRRLLLLLLGRQRLRVVGHGRDRGLDLLLRRALVLERLLLLRQLVLVQLVRVVLVKQLRQAHGVKELEVQQLRHLGQARPGGALLLAALLVGPLVVLAVVEQALALALGRVHPVVAHQRLEVNAGRLVVLVLVVVDGLHAAVQRERLGVLRELLHLGVQRRRVLLTLGDQRLHVGVRDVGRLGRKHQLRAVAHHAQQVVLAHLGGGIVGEAALLDDQRVQAQLLVRLLNHLLLNRVLNAEAEHLHLLLLADAMRAVHGLQIHLRVPVAVVQNDDVGGGQVDTQAAGARGQQEHKLLAAGRVVRVDGVLAVLAAGVAVDAAVLVAPV